MRPWQACALQHPSRPQREQAVQTRRSGLAAGRLITLSFVCVCVLTCTQRGKRFSLGSALLGAKPARNCYSPGQQAPDAWLLQLIEQHADGAVLSGLSASCRAGRDLVLQAARKATLQLRVADRKPTGKWWTLLLRVVGRTPDDDWRRQLAAAGKALAVRGARPTSLVLQRIRGYEALYMPRNRPPPPPECLARLALVPKYLHRQGAGITELVIDVWGGGWDMGPHMSASPRLPQHTQLRDHVF